MAKDQIYLNFFVSIDLELSFREPVLPQIVKSLQIIDDNVYGIKNNSYLCSGIIKLKFMPEIFRFYGFSFFFYSREHEPIHVHVEGNGGFAKFDWDGQNFVLKEQHCIKARDLKKITEVVDVNKDLIVKFWNEKFGYEDENNKDMVRR